MNLKKGDRVLCVENNSTVRPLVIESTDGGKVLFSKQLDKGVKKIFGLKEGSFQLIKPRYISEHEKKEYINPKLERHDRVKIIHVDGDDPLNVLGKNATVVGIKENERGDREIMLWVDELLKLKTLVLEHRMWPNQTGQDSLSGELIQKSLVLKLDEPKGKQEDYIDDLLSLNLTPQPVNEQTEQLYTGGPEDKKQKISPDLEVGDRIMAWDITGDRVLDTHLNVVVKEIPTTFMATVMKVLEYDQAHQNGIKYIVKIEDTDEVIGLYGGELVRIPDVTGEVMYLGRPHTETYEGKDKWLKLPKLKITEESDIFGQGLLDPIEPEEFEGEEEEWDELVGDVEEPEVEPEYSYKGGKTDPETGFVAPSAEVTDNICKVKGFCEAQGPITFGQLKALVEEATKKRIQADIGRGVFKSLWRIVPFFIPQVLLAAVGVTVTRAFNKIITPSLQNTGGYKSWWGKVVLKAMDVAEGDYIPDVALGDDPLSKIFFISDGLLQMIRDKYKLKFARYVADVASVMGDDKPVPEWFVENLLRDYLNQKFLLDPPLEPKEGTDFQMVMEHEEEMDPEDGIQTREPFTKTEMQILNYLTKEFTWEELNTISSIDETQVIGVLERKWDNTLKLFGQAPKGDDESWIRSTRWAKWAVENWGEACDGPDDVPCDFKQVTNPIKSWPSWFEVNADESYWQKEYRQGTIEIGAYDREDAQERAEISWWDYDPDMDHYDYGDTDDHELEMKDVTHMKALNEHDQSQDKEAIDTVQDIVDSVYPHIVNNLGKSEYVDETPKVELHRDIYERLSDIEGMEGEDSKTSKSEYESHVNTIYIYYPNMKNEKDVIQALLHEYTHSLQDPEKWEEHREGGYENNPYEQQSSDAEDNWEDYLIYLQEPLNEEIDSGSGFDYIFGDSIAVGLSVSAGEKYSKEMSTKLGWSREGARPQEILGKIREFIKDKDLTNKKVLVSSGYSNGQDLDSIRNEIDVLNGAGANVYLLGVSHTFPKEGEHNVILEEIANEKGITFLGGFDAPSDNVHPSYRTLYSSISVLNEHAGDRNMKGFTPKLIGYLKFLFETKEISNDYEFVRETTSLFNIGEWEAQALYLMLMYNSNHTGRKEMLEMLNNMPIEDYVIPQVWEYEVSYYGEYERHEDEEECSEQGQGETTGEDCECEQGVKYVQDKDGDEVEEDCDFAQDDDCECQEWWRKEFDMYYNSICTKTIYTITKLENTHEASDSAYGYEEMYEIDSELNDSNSVVVSEGCDLDYDDGQVWDYFHERDDEIIGLDTDKLAERLIPNLLERINNKIYRIKPLIDIIEDQYDVMSDKDTKMKDLTSQIFDILDDSFDMAEHPEGEIEYDGKNIGLYSYENDSFVPFEHIYNPIIQMLEGGIQQEDVEVFVEVITNWVNYVMSEKKEYLNEEVNIKSEDSNYSKEDYENFVDFAHKELKIEKDCPIDVETEKSTEYTTGNYHIHNRKITILDNGRKLADILRTIAHELVHHKQNELGMLVGDIPEIGGKIEDQANAYAGRLVKKYGKQTPNLYLESKIDIISEEKVVGFNNPSNNFVVIAGGPGAGKSFITKNLVNLDNVKEFNVDQVRVMTAKKLWGDEWEEKISTEEGYDEILRRTFTTSDPRNLTVKFLKQFLQTERDQPVNVIYDAGGGQEQVMKDIHQLAKENGFTTTLVHVRTPLDIAQERNIDRPRSLPPEMVAQYHQQVKDNMRNMIPIFDNVWSVDNKELIDLSDRPSDNIEKIK